MKLWVKAVIIILLVSVTISFANATPPQVVSTYPSPGTTNVPCDTTVVSITFSEPMQQKYYGFTTNWYPYTVSWSDDSTTIYLTRTEPFNPGTQFTLTLAGGGFWDLEGESLQTPYTFSFVIDRDCNDVIPYVVSTSPANGEADVPCNQTVVSITFNEPMQRSASITSNWVPFEISWSNDSTIVYFNRSSGQPLSPGTQVTFTLNPDPNSGFQDFEGNFLPTYTFSFTIAQDCQSSGIPDVVETYPQNGATGVPRDLPYISITFSEPMQAASSTSASNWVPSTQSWSEDKKTFYITPTPPNMPNFGAQVILKLNPAGYDQRFKDLEGNPLQPYTFSFNIVDDSRLQKIEANPEKGFHWPYYLFVPDTLSSSTTLLVEPNNTGTSSDDPMFHDNSAHNLICDHSWFALDLNVPLLIPTFPRPITPQAPEPGGVYTHALDRYSLSLETLPENLRRVDLQLIAMIEDVRRRFKNFGYQIDNKVFLMGFSASGAFVSRFTILHPEIVKALAPGSPGGWPTAPISEWDGTTLWYPVGVADVEQLIGNPFDLNTFRTVPQYIYVGDQDTNDALDIRGMPQEDRDGICALLNCSPNPYIANRWPISEQMYNSVGANAEFQIYPGVPHSISTQMWLDLKNFFQRHNTNIDIVQKTYIGYYQRPADPSGLIYWANRLSNSGGNLSEIIEAFANSAESQVLYGTINSSNISTVVNGIYNALFGRDAEAGGLSYYVNGFNSGQFTAATIMLNVLYGAQNEDLQSVNNKVTAANLFTRTIDPELDGRDFQVTYAGDSDAIAGRNFLNLITWDSTTVPTQDETTAYIKTNIANPGDPILGQTPP